VAGIVAESGGADYVAAKPGVIGVTKVAALEYAAQRIRVNALAPGWAEAPMTAVWNRDSVLDARLRGIVPIGRPAKSEEMAGAVLYLCSDAAST
jgi:NAD(P)-dependent dehydrogenase (short-subunit alcohol dehydrogenase family)